MAVGDGFRDLVLERVGPLVIGLRHRPMFGGVSLSCEAGTFALIDDDILYLKGDKAVRGEFEAAGWPPFRPFGPEGSAMGYFAVPGELLDEPAALQPWVNRAVAAARRSGSGSRRR
ncbi:MAG: TfoX/Sxy family protein [Gemmatimonadales bacterium]|nr:TfoX/Sxy family protein [Gemmatimonadales bacterium]HRX18572.1 TfoX/Sxy family protein [Gemmatimonadales bacterium]